MPDGLQHESRTRKFLIVDDHTAFRRTIRPFLPAGTIVECADGCEAVAACAAERPDWVLMDIEMPGMDGLTATKELKKRFPETQIIIVTNHGEEEFRVAARELGVSGLILKEHLQELVPMIAAGEQRQRPQ
ncbi:MAG TPA: response regulator transcription factor [Candidatus Acidoferrum sp.]|nr:response regulator transcription factor [Candidatus Acidoferrum sp.]